MPRVKAPPGTPTAQEIAVSHQEQPNHGLGGSEPITQGIFRKQSITPLQADSIPRIPRETRENKTTEKMTLTLREILCYGNIARAEMAKILFKGLCWKFACSTLTSGKNITAGKHCLNLAENTALRKLHRYSLKIRNPSGPQHAQKNTPPENTVQKG